MGLIQKFFGNYNKTIAQIFFNAEDIKQEKKKENLTNTFNMLIKINIVPIINENDAVSYTEIKFTERLFGDNDMLSVVIAIFCQAERLVIDTLYYSTPRLQTEAKLIERIEQIDDSVYSLAVGVGLHRNMEKLQAESLATAQRISTIVTNVKNSQEPCDIVKGVNIGTLFVGRCVK